MFSFFLYTFYLEIPRTKPKFFLQRYKYPCRSLNTLGVCSCFIACLYKNNLQINSATRGILDMTCNPKRLLKSTIHIYEIMPSHYDISYAFLIWNGFFMHIKHILTSSFVFSQTSHFLVVFSLPSNYFWHLIWFLFALFTSSKEV